MTMHIYLPPKAKKELAQTFKVSGVTLWNALNFVHNSPKSKALRAAAMQRGGILFDTKGRSISPNHITTFETADETMTQRFSDRVYLIADFRTGIVTVYDSDEVVMTVENPTMSELIPIQQKAQALANTYKK